MTDWTLVIRGGEFAGDWPVSIPRRFPEPGEVLIAWRCGSKCEGHFTFDATDAGIVLGRATSYRRIELEPEEARATYELGDLTPDTGWEAEVEELVGAGAGISLETLSLAWEAGA